MWPLLFQLIPAALSAIPKIQALFGPTKDAEHGVSKADAALSLVMTEVPELAALLGVDPKWKGVISAGITLVYEFVKASGRLPSMTATAAVVLAAPATPVVDAPGA